MIDEVNRRCRRRHDVYYSNAMMTKIAILVDYHDDDTRCQMRAPARKREAEVQVRVTSGKR